MKRLAARLVAAGAALLLGAAAGLGLCGPFTDVFDVGFCPLVLEIFYLGITTGTTPTTYDPTGNVNRLQMAAFLSRSVDSVLQRGSRRVIVKKFWTPQNGSTLGLTTLPASPRQVQTDGADVWVGSFTGASVTRVGASDGRILGTWTGATQAYGLLVAMGRVFAAGQTAPGRLYQIDPTQPAGSVTTVSSNLGDGTQGVAFDGGRIWTANASGQSVSIVTPGATIPWTATTVTIGGSGNAALFDGSNVWVVSFSARALLKLDQNGAVLQTVTVGLQPSTAVFDGTNIWVPNFGSTSVSVVRAATGVVLATLTANGLSQPGQPAFDGQRVLVTNETSSVSIWKAADLTPLGNFPTGTNTNPIGACSDGISFWLALGGSTQLGKF